MAEEVASMALTAVHNTAERNANVVRYTFSLEK